MAETWNLVCLLETEEAPVIDDDKAHSMYEKKRAFFQSVSLVYPKTQNPVVSYTGDDVA